MKYSPFLHAGAAAIYVAGISSFLFYVPKRLVEESNTVAVPVAMLSLFVLSAAIMGFLFLSRPIMLFIDGRKDEAVRFFGKTVLAFALMTALFFAALFLPQALL